MLANFPRALVHLINKRPTENIKDDMDEESKSLLKSSARFTPEDIEKVERICLYAARCHEIINKIEQLHAMKYISKGIEEINNKLYVHVE